MSKHAWTYKTISGGRFLVCCPGCGKEDEITPSERSAQLRVAELNGQFRQRQNSLPPKTSVSRRMRRTKRAKRILAGAVRMRMST